MNLNGGVRPLGEGVKVFCEKCAKQVDEVAFERDLILLRDRLVARCHGEIETIPIHLELEPGIEIRAFGSGVR